LFDEKLYPAGELISLYHERWEEELVFDEQKTHQDPRRASKPANLRSETPAGVIQELYALSLAHFVTRALMFQAARAVSSWTPTNCRSRVVSRFFNVVCRNVMPRPWLRSRRGMKRCCGK
jgi:hypothetical protein